MVVEDQSETFSGVAAATGETIGPAFRISTLAEVDQCCAAAHSAFAAYRETSREARAAFLEAIADEIIRLGDELIDRAVLESGLPVGRITGERARTVNQLRLFAQVVRDGHWLGVRIDPAQPDRTPLPRADLRLRMIPLGPVAVFGASNFPLAFSTAGGDTASALAAGCPVIVKGHPAHPGTDTMVADAIKRAVAAAGMPEGTFGHIRGPGIELGQALVADGRIAAVGFTGSRAGGLALMSLAQKREVPIPVYAEMSSINPVIVLPAALAQRAQALASGFVGSLTLGAGQFCTNPGLVIMIDGDGADEFVEASSAALAQQSPQPMLTGGILRAYEAGVDIFSRHQDVKAIGSSLAGDGATCAASRLFTTTAASFMNDSALANEVFGASSLVIRCQSLDEVKRVLGTLEGQLTATLQLESGDEAAAVELVSLLELRAGRILVNGWPTGVEVSHAMVHGGPFPATSDGRTTSVGTMAIDRFLRPICYQDFPENLLPRDLRDGVAVPRLVDGKVA